MSLDQQFVCGKQENMKLQVLVYKLIKKLNCSIFTILDNSITHILFWGNGVEFKHFRTNGIPYVMVAMDGKMSIGNNFAMNNGIKGNPIGCYERCTFFVNKGAELMIGDNVGLSQTALISDCTLKIGNNVKIGGGTSVYTTDFHSLDAKIRATVNDLKNKKSASVVINDNVFIGAKCIILKGVTIGENSIVGAGSVVTRSIPADEIWAGNPAKFIRKVDR